MKSLVVYSSRTGNTEKVARAIHEILPAPCDIHSVETAPDPGDRKSTRLNSSHGS